MVGGDPRAPAALARVTPPRPVLLFPARVGPARPPTRVASFEIELWDEHVIGLSPIVAAWLDADLRAVTVHVPIDPRAVSEANALLVAPRVSVPSVAVETTGALHRRLRSVVVSVSDCGSSERGIASCPLPGAPCAKCAGSILEATVGLRAADALAPHEARVLAAKHPEELADLDRDDVALALRRPPEPGWIRALTRDEGGPARLVDAALAAEIDPVDDLVTRAMLGRRGPRAMR